MWIMLSDAFLSIVQHKDDPTKLCVRSRARGDIENLWSYADVTETPDADYRFRAVLPRENVAGLIERELLFINYTNFKNSVPEEDRHDAYLDVWAIMHQFQRNRLNKERRNVGRVSTKKKPDSA